MLTWPNKDPDEVLDYQINWTSRLDGDTISTSTWIIPDGIVGGDEDISGSTTILWLSGGTLGDRYTITNRITTAGGRTMDQSVKITIRAK
jgi:hypothetical protein